MIWMCIARSLRHMGICLLAPTNEREPLPFWGIALRDTRARSRAAHIGRTFDDGQVCVRWREPRRKREEGLRKG